MGIGIQGMNDLLMRLRIPFESEDAIVINRNIFETIYYGALLESN